MPSPPVSMCVYTEHVDNNRFDAERRARLEAEDKYAHLSDKLQFDCGLHDQEVKDLHDRLENLQKYVVVALLIFLSLRCA